MGIAHEIIEFFLSPVSENGRGRIRDGGPMTPLAVGNGASVYNCDWRTLLDVVPECDAVIRDCPYSARTHKGHDDAVNDDMRREINYAAWTPEDVHAFVEAWHPRCKGWFVSITDHILAPSWEAAFEKEGRYTFAPLVFFAPGSRVRMQGDGPSLWTCQIVVSRPKNREFARWGALPGGYYLPAGRGDALPVVGGKPIWLMNRLVEDYSRAGDLVCDPCMGAGTTLVGAIRAGRRAIGGDINAEHAQLAARWIERPYQAAPGSAKEIPGQLPMFAL